MKSIKASSCLLALTLGLPLFSSASVKIPSLGAADGADIRIASYYEGTDLKGRQVDLPQVNTDYPLRSKSFQDLVKRASHISPDVAAPMAQEAAAMLPGLIQEMRVVYKNVDIKAMLKKIDEFEKKYLLSLIAFYYDAGYINTPGDVLAPLMLPNAKPWNKKAANIQVIGMYMFLKALAVDRVRDALRKPCPCA